ncbi:ZYRO0E01452p [Zygosaccharomyces rouxii]|uniref:ZYRO0E01452p n=1 Tax=Zygosaccharomyces rouxii (strain ATCC 2623 / CBS 732 / NBRC 1130 / NCYC 568 / NRRL Y-229) TaxID=559307 RepID=C5E3Z4_ZYGRC|nr:uncharacterized protein ZYRO0E01452g [Zygosaccharomyces rouxii]KAH9198384.1 hypothetical protein LQ764DRAFT_158792 [Zygosaccharomyces rouxii]CAR30755.1 ZYRO0E01452p [Zygosaccharomyces rouxii]
MGNDDNEHALEDLRSKIIASMSNEPSSNKRTALAGDEMHNNKRQRNRDDGSRGYKNGYSGPNYPKRHQSNPRSRYQAQQQQKRFPPRPQYSRYQGNAASNTSVGKFREEDLAHVVPLGERKRMRPTKWDITPKGFESVPTERAKLSKLFPQPGKPHELDRDKLEKVIAQGGTNNRRTRILFEDADGNHLIFSRMSCRIIVRGTTDSMDLNRIEAYLNGFVQAIDREYHVKEVVQGPSHLVLEFNDAVCTTIVLSCRSFISKELDFDGSDWQRPQEYVQQVDSSERLCGPEILAVEGLVHGEEKELTDQGFKVVFMEPIFTISQENQERLFTGCALVEVEEEPSANGSLRWFKPNESHMKQNISYMTFQGLPKLATDQVRVPSRVLLLMNLVDPLDLKLEAFAQEVKTTLESTLHKVESVRMKKPSADFRLNLERIGEGVGNVYVKFQDVESAEAAMENLPHRKFNGRSVLCCYVAESDFETLGIL